MGWCVLPVVVSASALLLSQAPAAAPAPPRLRVVVMDLRNDGVTPETARLVGDAVAARLGALQRFEVLSSEDVRRIADVEAQRSLIGCDQTSCLAELADALGAERVVYGSIGLIGSVYQLNLNVFDSDGARVVARDTARVATLDALPDEADRAVVRLAAQVLGEPEAGGFSPWAWATLAGTAVGATGVVVGAVVGGTGYAGYTDLSQNAAARTSAQTQMFIGLAVAGSGVLVTALSGVGLAGALND